MSGPRRRSKIRDFVAVALDQAHDECIYWPFRISTSGYPEATIRGRHVAVHAYICAKVHGPRPPRADAAHRCGNRDCIQKRHLRWATRAENHADKRQHGTHLEGEVHPAALLRAEDVLAIRAASRARGVATRLALYYGVHSNTIYAVRSGRSWKCV